MRLGLAESAVSRFETILERHPDLARVQLELAVAYYALGIDDKAKLHIKSTLTENLPFSVESTVKEFLRRIDTRKPWSAFFSFSMLPESNALRRSDVTVVSIGGLPFELDQDSRPSSGVGLLFSGGVSHSTILADNLRGLVAVSGAAKMYENTELNDVTIVADLGLSQQFGSKSMSEGLRFGRQWIGGKRFRRIFGVWTQFRWQKSRSVEFELPVSVEYHRYATQSYRDGVEFSVAPRFDFAVNDRTLVGVQPRVEFIGAKNAHHQKHVVGIGFGFNKSFESGLSISLNPSFHRKRHAANDPLFGVRRLDEQFIFSVGFSHQAFRYKGFVPQFSYVYEQNQSNIPVNEYQNQGLNINISREF